MEDVTIVDPYSVPDDLGEEGLDESEEEVEEIGLVDDMDFSEAEREGTLGFK